MNVLAVYAHPNPASFCHALLERVTKELRGEGHKVRIKDLYAEGFDPVFSAEELAAVNARQVPAVIAREQDDLRWADALVIIYPLWWYSQPAILKGWIDKVFTHGFAFGYGPEGLKGLLPVDKVLVIVTVGTSEAEYRAMDACELIIRPLTEGVFGFCGVKDVRQKIFYRVTGVTHEARMDMLEEAAEAARGL